MNKNNKIIKMGFNGTIQLILGPMFSGKSTELIRLLRRYQLAKYKCNIIKYSKDDRYGNDEFLYTHDKLSIPAISSKTLNEAYSHIIDVDVIGIDEGQFFPDIVNFSESMANIGKIVIIAALDGTYKRSPFNDILQLIPLSEKVIKLNAVCMNCCGEASFSKRISDEKEIEIIGGSEKYKSVCRKCYFMYKE
ncbi:thymidine kinase [Deerpox virus W-1170-84]|uniref:Thymidine kinase n=1 Tax=Deerpox virus (strain W-1170-84) TaxID=305676 RepID=Q08FA7_DPV84|nr:thymidine kinase [Deerpox virus W-1170-84]